jgi:predicted O-methyltransferase YrrM
MADPIMVRLAVIPGVVWNGSSCTGAHELTFRAILEHQKPKAVIEIGTHQGVSAALLSDYADRVVTFDVFPNKTRALVWKLLECADKIVERVHMAQKVRDTEIAGAAKVSDLAFIDGSHLMNDVALDFRLVAGAGCRKIVMHDYWPSGRSWPDVKEFVDGLDRKMFYVEIFPPFAYVEVL